MTLQHKRRNWSNRIAIGMMAVLVIVLLSHPVRSFLADWQFRKAAKTLKEMRLDYADRAILTTKNFPLYLSRMRGLEMATELNPRKAEYRLALSELNYKLGIWIEAMKKLNVELPEACTTESEVIQRALREAIVSVDNDPISSSVHLANGNLYRKIGDKHRFRQSYDRAKAFYPVNAEVRYRIARDYLLEKMDADALAEAVALVQLDDSFRLVASTWNEQHRLRRSEYFSERVRTSYFYRALEIIWRASGKDRNAIINAVPDDEDAKAALQIYIETKGLDF